MSDNILQLNEAAIKGELKDLVKNSVEETLNALLDHEADELVNAERYERSGDRNNKRPGLSLCHNKDYHFKILFNSFSSIS